MEQPHAGGGITWGLYLALEALRKTGERLGMLCGCYSLLDADPFTGCVRVQYLGALRHFPAAGSTLDMNAS